MVNLSPEPNRVKVALEPMALSPREGQVEDGESNSYLVTAVAITTVEFDFVNIKALALRPNEAPDGHPPAVTSADGDSSRGMKEVMRGPYLALLPPSNSTTVFTRSSAAPSTLAVSSVSSIPARALG
jgi:hypothetical protein